MDLQWKRDMRQGVVTCLCGTNVESTHTIITTVSVKPDVALQCRSDCSMYQVAFSTSVLSVDGCCWCWLETPADGHL